MSELGIARSSRQDGAGAYLALERGQHRGRSSNIWRPVQLQGSRDPIGVQHQGTFDRILQKARELYPDMLVQIDTIFVSGDRALTEWTLQTTLLEPFFGNSKRRVPISLHGASVVLTENGRITSWSDYYDGLISRRTSLASYFTEWVEY
jgi:hypothetical protein